ncbi:unnamed protein product [Ceutorhynchus assimilis]|uniref:Ketimine reductase mu-crystallin n=1 Tax=Ceutorhynchus assimilis TaxID=467358 RepID=A0A9N9QER2_9CUCU|nr:unnamed protein product [Ceutorhynchus assimilis]
MIFISEAEIASLLTWEGTLKATEAALKAASNGTSAKTQRLYTQILNTPKWMITMPGYLEDSKYGGWACKTLTGNPQNVNGPTLNANIMLFDERSGALKTVLSGTEITNWRTAAASAVATKYLHSRVSNPEKVLSIFGCGEIGRAHAHCFYNSFEFIEIRLWNRTLQKAQKLASELNEKYNTTKFRVFENKEACARDADVIITATSPGKVPLIKYEWLKEGVHINATGVVGSSLSDKTFELDREIYKHSEVYVDNWPGANAELGELTGFGANMKAEVGEVILGKIAGPDGKQISVFQSLGMASEDCAMARLIYDLYMKKQQKNTH